MRCRRCGYFADVHDLGTRKCPVCACGATPAEHQPNCPGRVGKDGLPLKLRRGSYEPGDGRPTPVDERTARILSVITANLPPIDHPVEVELVEVVTGPPQVAARPPYGPGEFAGYRGKQAVGLGRRAMDKGWNVAPLYWRAFDGTEGCGVWLLKGPLRAFGTWKRAAGKVGASTGWGTDIAYAWRSDVARFPTKLTHTQLDELIT